MALAALAPLLGSVLAPAAADAVGLGISPLLAASVGSGLGTWAATGNPLTGLEGGALGYGAGSLLGGLGGAAKSAAMPLDTLSTDAPVNSQDMLAAAGLGTPSPALSGLSDTLSAGASPVTNAGMMAQLGGADVASPAADIPALTSAAPVSQLSLNALMKNSIPGIAGAMLVPQTTASTATGSAAVNDPGMRPYTQLQQVYSPGSYTPSQSGTIPYFFQNTSNFAGGGKVASAPSGGVDSRSLSFLNHEAMRSGMPYPKAGGGSGGGGGLVHAVSPQFGKGVPMPLGMADGGGVPSMLASMPPSGQPMPSMAVPPIAGDGSSDSIPATIDGKAPALLSSDEHIIPADAVSALGNGSSAAGHKQLQSMVNRVRQAKTGSRGMPPRISAGMMMPG